MKQGGTLTVALSAEPDKLDPTLSRSLYSRYVFNAICEKLYDVDEQTPRSCRSSPPRCRRSPATA